MKSGFHISAGLSSVTDHISSENTKRTDDIEFRPEQLKQLLDFLSVFLIHYRKTLVTEKTLFEQATLRAYDFAVSSEGNDDILAAINPALPGPTAPPPLLPLLFPPLRLTHGERQAGDLSHSPTQK